MNMNDHINSSSSSNIKEGGSNQEDPSNAHDNNNHNHNHNHSHAFVAICGLVAASIGSTILHLHRMEHPDAFPSIPHVSFAHSVALCVTTMCIMMLFIYHSLSTLKLLTLGMPMIPSPIPYLGHGIRFMQTSPWDLLLQWHKQKGSIFCFPLMGRTVVSIASPTFLKLVLQSQIRNVKKDVGFSYQPFLVILGNGIVTSEGHTWMKQRLKMSTALRRDVLDRIPHVTLQAVQRLYVQLDAAAASQTAVDLSEALRHLTLQVISKAFLSLSADESDATLATMYLPIVDECNTRVWQPWRSACVFLPFWWRHQYHISRLDSYVSKLIYQRWKDGIRKHDMLDIVMGDAWDEKVLSATTIRQIRDEMKTFLLAGHETSAAMMTWAFYEMMNSDTLMKEVATEGEVIFGSSKTTDWAVQSESALPSSESLAKLVVAEGTLKESLRKYSVVPLVIRHCIHPIPLGPYTLTKGTTLIINIQAVHHDPNIWPNPMTFDPHRFIMDDPNNNNKKPEPYTFLPFIDGPRNCLGQHLALLESKMVLGLLTQRYHFQMASSQDNEPPIIQTELHGALDRDPRHRYIVPVSVKKALMVKVTKK